MLDVEGEAVAGRGAGDGPREHGAAADAGGESARREDGGRPAPRRPHRPRGGGRCDVGRSGAAAEGVRGRRRRRGGAAAELCGARRRSRSDRGACGRGAGDSRRRAAVDTARPGVSAGRRAGSPRWGGGTAAAGRSRVDDQRGDEEGGGGIRQAREGARCACRPREPAGRGDRRPGPGQRNPHARGTVESHRVSGAVGRGRGRRVRGQGSGNPGRPCRRGVPERCPS